MLECWVYRHVRWVAKQYGGWDANTASNLSIGYKLEIRFTDSKLALITLNGATVQHWEAQA